MSFCSFIKGIPPNICILCFVLINTVFVLFCFYVDEAFVCFVLWQELELSVQIHLQGRVTARFFRESGTACTSVSTECAGEKKKRKKRTIRVFEDLAIDRS